MFKNLKVEKHDKGLKKQEWKMQDVAWGICSNIGANIGGYIGPLGADIGGRIGDLGGPLMFYFKKLL